MFAIDLIDRSFQKGSSRSYDLSLQAHQNGLAYCIYDKTQEQYVAFRQHNFEHVHLAEDLTNQITSVLEKDDLLDLSFHFVRFLGYTQQSTLVPAAYFDRSRMFDYLSFNHSGEVDQELFSNSIKASGMYNVFALPRNLVSTITLHFKKVEFLNQTTPFLKHLASEQDTQSTPVMHIGLNQVFFDMACVSDGKLKLYNTFQYTGESDLLYYVLYVFKQLGLNPQEVPLYLTGELCTKLSYYEILRQYIPGTRYALLHNIPALTPALYQINKAKYLNLLNTITCALSAEHTEAEK